MKTITIEIPEKVIKTKNELKRIYDKLKNENTDIDMSTNFLLDTENALPDSITLSKNGELIDDLYISDNSRGYDYLSVIDSVEENNYDFLLDKNIDVAFHYGKNQIDLGEINTAISKNKKNYFMNIFAYNKENQTTELYAVKI